MRLAIWTSPAGLYSRLSTRLKGTIPNPDDIKESYRAKQRLLREEKANSAGRTLTFVIGARSED